MTMASNQQLTGGGNWTENKNSDRKNANASGKDNMGVNLSHGMGLMPPPVGMHLNMGSNNMGGAFIHGGMGGMNIPMTNLQQPRGQADGWNNQQMPMHGLMAMNNPIVNANMNLGFNQMNLPQHQNNQQLQIMNLLRHRNQGTGINHQQQIQAPPAPSHIQPFMPDQAQIQRQQQLLQLSLQKSQNELHQNQHHHGSSQGGGSKSPFQHSQMAVVQAQAQNLFHDQFQQMHSHQGGDNSQQRSSSRPSSDILYGSRPSSISSAGQHLPNSKSISGQQRPGSSMSQQQQRRSSQLSLGGMQSKSNTSQGDQSQHFLNISQSPLVPNNFFAQSRANSASSTGQHQQNQSQIASNASLETLLNNRQGAQNRDSHPPSQQMVQNQSNAQGQSQYHRHSIQLPTSSSSQIPSTKPTSIQHDNDNPNFLRRSASDTQTTQNENALTGQVAAQAWFLFQQSGAPPGEPEISTKTATLSEASMKSIKLSAQNEAFLRKMQGHMKQQGSEFSQNPTETNLIHPTQMKEKNQAQQRQPPSIKEPHPRPSTSPSNNVIAADGDQKQVHGKMTQIQSNPQQLLGMQPQRSSSEGSIFQPQQQEDTLLQLEDQNHAQLVKLQELQRISNPLQQQSLYQLQGRRPSLNQLYHHNHQQLQQEGLPQGDQFQQQSRPSQREEHMMALQARQREQQLLESQQARLSFNFSQEQRQRDHAESFKDANQRRLSQPPRLPSEILVHQQRANAVSAGVEAISTDTNDTGSNRIAMFGIQNHYNPMSKKRSQEASHENKNQGTAAPVPNQTISSPLVSPLKKQRHHVALPLATSYLTDETGAETKTPLNNSSSKSGDKAQRNRNASSSMTNEQILHATKQLSTEEKIVFASKQLLGNGKNGFSRVKTMQRLKRTRVRQVGSSEELDEEQLKKKTFNSQFGKKLHTEMIKGLQYTNLMAEVLKSIIADIDPDNALLSIPVPTILDHSSSERITEKQPHSNASSADQHLDQDSNSPFCVKKDSPKQRRKSVTADKGAKKRGSKVVASQNNLDQMLLEMLT